jgi:tetratricopeptide (TPR) repeat protein
MNLDIVAIAVFSSVPTDEKADLFKCARILPHAKTVTRQMEGKKVSWKLQGGVQNTIGSIFYHQGQYSEAKNRYQRVLDSSEKILGKGHPSTLGRVHNMALVYHNQGEYGKALEWHQRALDG